MLVGQKKDIINKYMLPAGYGDMRMLKRYGHTREDVKKAAVEKLKPVGMDRLLDIDNSSRYQLTTISSQNEKVI